MLSVGFPISHKENEKRRAIMPEDIKKIANPSFMLFEKGYGEVLNVSDEEYKNCGCKIACREEVLSQKIVCDAKIGDADYLESLNEGTAIFGWVHAVQNRDITDKLINRKLTAYAWEDMFYKGRHTFYRNNEIAGEAAIMHAFEMYGEMPFGKKVALIGRGNVASGALKILTLLGAAVTVYDRRTIGLLSCELERYDVVVNALLWDTERSDHIINKSDLKRMKKNALIIDVSCDRAGAIETSVPTTIDDPVYTVDGIMHYVVDHTPALFYKMTSISISAAAAQYIDLLIRETPDEVLQNALIIENGNIVDKRIIEFQHR